MSTLIRALLLLTLAEPSISSIQIQTAQAQAPQESDDAAEMIRIPAKQDVYVPGANLPKTDFEKAKALLQKTHPTSRLLKEWTSLFKQSLESDGSLLISRYDTEGFKAEITRVQIKEFPEFKGKVVVATVTMKYSAQFSVALFQSHSEKVQEIFSTSLTQPELGTEYDELESAQSLQLAGNRLLALHLKREYTGDTGGADPHGKRIELVFFDSARDFKKAGSVEITYQRTPEIPGHKNPTPSWPFALRTKSLDLAACRVNDCAEIPWTQSESSKVDFGKKGIRNEETVYPDVKFIEPVLTKGRLTWDAKERVVQSLP